MPTTRKSSAIGRPVRWEARLKITLTPSSSPQVARSRAVASGSWGNTLHRYGLWAMGLDAEARPAPNYSASGTSE